MSCVTDVEKGSRSLRLFVVLGLELYVYKVTVCLFSTSAETDLRGNVIRGPTESSRGHAFKYALFAHAKVRQLTVTVFVQKDIVQF